MLARFAQQACARRYRCGLAGVAEPFEDAQQFAERPCLERCAARLVRRIAIGDLGNMVEPGAVEMREQRRDKPLASERALRRRGWSLCRRMPPIAVRSKAPGRRLLPAGIWYL